MNIMYREIMKFSVLISSATIMFWVRPHKIFRKYFQGATECLHNFSWDLRKSQTVCVTTFRRVLLFASTFWFRQDHSVGPIATTNIAYCVFKTLCGSIVGVPQTNESLWKHGVGPFSSYHEWVFVKTFVSMFFGCCYIQTGLQRE